jgi:hypothetical protein
MVEAVNSCMIYLIHVKNLHKCHNVPPPFPTIKEKKASRLKQPELSMQFIKDKYIILCHILHMPFFWPNYKFPYSLLNNSAYTVLQKTHRKALLFIHNGILLSHEEG